MARVTVEDCIDKVENRYELVALAARRAKDIASGSPLTVERDNDKDAVVALREIADETVQVPDLRENLITTHQRRQSMERFMQTEAGDSEVESVFADEQSAVAQPAAEGGISFADDNVDVED